MIAVYSRLLIAALSNAEMDGLILTGYSKSCQKHETGK